MPYSAKNIAPPSRYVGSDPFFFFFNEGFNFPGSTQGTRPQLSPRESHSLQEVEGTYCEEPEVMGCGAVIDNGSLLQLAIPIIGKG